jgi:hypothetical protein
MAMRVAVSALVRIPDPGLVIPSPSSQWGDWAYGLGRLMNSMRRKRSADQSSSIATARTVSKPDWRSTSQPSSRLKSQAAPMQVELTR